MSSSGFVASGSAFLPRARTAPSTLHGAGLRRRCRPRAGSGAPVPLTKRRCNTVRASATSGNGSADAGDAAADDGDASASAADDEATFVLEEDDAASDEDATFVCEEDVTDAVLARGKPVRAPSIGVADAALVGVIMAVVYGLAATTRRFMFSSTPYTSLVIDTSLRVLPSYALQSLTRMLAGYVVSLVFSLGYAYVAFRVKFAAQALMLAIDVLQSIPLLSFLPGVVLGLIALFPAGARVGVELAAVLLLFTSMAWNMLLGFYQSLSGIPNDLQDVAQSFRLTPWKRFWVLELPAGGIGLIWNSIISVAGGWFFLISIESFELGNRDFRLPGLGSFLAAAAEAGDYAAIAAALAVIIAIIVVIDFCVWRPLLTWSSKFKHGGGGSSGDTPKSLVFNLLTRSLLVRSFSRNVFMPAWESFVSLDLPRMPRRRPASAAAGGRRPPPLSPETQVLHLVGRWGVHAARRALGIVLVALPSVARLLFYIAVGVGSWRAGNVMRFIPRAQWATLMTGAACTFGRVCAALALSLLWTVPVGISIGRNPELAERVQPIVQIAASVPATAIFPVFLASLARLGGGLEVGSVALMTLGTMWYVLVNVIAGTQAIPAELFDVDAVYGRGWVRRWRTLILPGIFPYLVTGVVTAVGGAWNASIVSEYVVFRGGVMQTHGLGALISEAAAGGDYPLLLAGTVVMSVLVLLTNRFVWGPLQRLSETKYRI
jgi:NitT/TauT family transport system permease protein